MFFVTTKSFIYVQQSKVYNKIFYQFAIDLLSRKLADIEKASRINVVFDDYRNISIKNVERDRRSSGDQFLFNIIVSSAVITMATVSLL